jgi:electron transfer flavoprotein alpha/beta subunit
VIVGIPAVVTVGLKLYNIQEKSYEAQFKATEAQIKALEAQNSLLKETQSFVLRLCPRASIEIPFQPVR